MSIGKHQIVEFFDLGNQGQASIRDHLLEILQDDQWSCLAVVRIGFKGAHVDESPVTVLISVKPSAVATSRAVEIVNGAADYIYRCVIKAPPPTFHFPSWIYIYIYLPPHLLTLFPSFHELRDVAIEIGEADFSPSDAKYAISELGYAFEDCYCINPSMGASLGLSGGRGSGSLGGYLRLRIRSESKVQETKYLALTCHHVLSGK